MQKTFFISDLHLSEARPDLTTLFVDVMENLIPQGQALYVLGDLFDFWVGDDECSPLVCLVQSYFRRLTEQGVVCYFLAGNRDFLLGKKFAQSCGLQLLPEYTVVDFYGIPTLLCHGDTLCTDDKAYQRYRKTVHNPWLQRLFLCLPLNLRLRLAHKIRRKSQQDKCQKQETVMDVNSDFVQKIMAQHHVTQLIHGHTHRQAIHHIKQGKRIVLGDWGHQASVLCLTPTGEAFVEQA